MLSSKYFFYKINLVITDRIFLTLLLSSLSIPNMKKLEGKNVNLEGILYAQNSNDIILDEKYKWMDHIVTIKTVNLNQEWKNIEKDLLEVCF